MIVILGQSQCTRPFTVSNQGTTLCGRPTGGKREGKESKNATKYDSIRAGAAV
jgi:hypothetical protein